MSRSSSASNTTVAGAGLNISSSSSSSSSDGTASRSRAAGASCSMTRARRPFRPFPPSLSKPAPMTVTRTTSPSTSSMTAPKLVLGDVVRVTVIAAGFDKLGGNGRNGRLARVIEQEAPAAREREAVPSLLEEEEDEEMFKPAPATVVFDADEDLDIPDFLKS